MTTIELLEDLHQRLVLNYNDNIPFEQTEEDRLVVLNVIEKQTPKKPTPHKVDVEKIKIGNGYWGKGTTIYYCPNCKDFISRIYTYCHKCGQALDWGDTE